MALILHRIIYTTATILLVTSYVSSQISNELDVGDIEKQFNITGLENFNSSKLPDEEDFERVFKEKCKKNGGDEETYNKLKNQAAEIQACVESQVNVTQLQAELEVAKKTGSMEEVFSKYCNKYPKIRNCFTDIVDQIRPCFDENEQGTLNQTLEIVDEMKEFICFDEGDRLAMFIAEGGLECLESKQNEVQNCVNKTVGSRIPTDFTLNSLPSFLFTDQECKDFEKIRDCVNVELEKCKNSTPANIVDAFFKYLKNQLPCAESYKDSANSGTVLSHFVIVSVIIAKFL